MCSEGQWLSETITHIDSVIEDIGLLELIRVLINFSYQNIENRRSEK